MPQWLFEGQQPYEPSDFLIDDVESVEVTLCHEPAVAGAKFRIIRSTGDADNRIGTVDMKFQRAAKTNKQKQQVLGYVSTPWMEDWYGDVMDTDSIEGAAHSFLKNLTNQNVEGNGIGEEHRRFWSNAHVVESVIDRNGSIGGIPGGWWMNIQITNPEVWNKVLSEQYTGFSLGSQVKYTYTRHPSFVQEVFDSIPSSLSKATPVEPKEGKTGAFINPGDYGYPTERSAYADPNNNKFPIDTRSRAYAVLRHILKHWEEEGYTAGELKYMTQRMLAAIHTNGDQIPDKTLQRVGFADLQSITDFALQQGISKKQPDQPKTSSQQSVLSNTQQQAVSNNPIQGEEPNMNLDQVLAEFHEQSKQQNDLLTAVLNKLNKLNTAPLAEGTVPATQATPAAQVAPAAQAAPEAQATTATTPEATATAPATQAAPEAQATTAATTAAPETCANTQSAQTLLTQAVSQAVADVLKTQATATAQSAEAPRSITADDLQSALTQFGEELLKAISANNQSTNSAIEGIANRISEMPVPRATLNRTMSKDQKSTFLANIKKKIEDGSDISGDEMALATNFGVNFDLDDPMAGVAL